MGNYKIVTDPENMVDAFASLRKMAGVKQGQIAHVLGLKHSTISSYENQLRRPSLETIEAMFAALGFRMSITIEGSLPVSTKYQARTFGANPIYETFLAPSAKEAAIEAGIHWGVDFELIGVLQDGRPETETEIFEVTNVMGEYVISKDGEKV